MQFGWNACFGGSQAVPVEITDSDLDAILDRTRGTAVSTKLCEKTGSTSELEAGSTTSSSSSSGSSSTSSSGGNGQNSVYDDENEKENNEKRSRTSNSSNLQEGMECSAADFTECTPFTSIRTFEVSIVMLSTANRLVYLSYGMILLFF